MHPPLALALWLSLSLSVMACVTRPPTVHASAPISNPPSSIEPARQSPRVDDRRWIILNPVHDDGPPPEDVAVMDAPRELPEAR